MAQSQFKGKPKPNNGGEKPNFQEVKKLRDAEAAELKALSDENAEAAVLSWVLAENKSLDQIETILRPEDFFNPDHETLYAAAIQLVAKGADVDTITLARALNGTLEDQRKIASLRGIKRPQNVKHYAGIVHDFAIRRQIMTAAKGFLEKSKNRHGDPKATISDMLSELFEFGGLNVGVRSKSISEIIGEVIASSQEAARTGGQVVGVKTGFRAMDRHFVMRPGNLIILAGRPGHGKTTLALQIGANVVKTGMGVSFFSKEMTYEELGEQFVAQELSIPPDTIAYGRYSAEELDNMLRLQKQATHWKYRVHDSGGLTVAQFEMLARRDVEHNGTKLIILDYLQKLTPDGGRFSADWEKVSFVTQEIKRIAKDLKTPILCVTQMNQEFERRNMGSSVKKVEQGENASDLLDPPSITDLGQSGQIAREADVVCFIYRPEKMMRIPEPGDINSPEWAKWDAQRQRYANQAKLYMPKIRKGIDPAYGEIRFEPWSVSFRDLVQ